MKYPREFCSPKEGNIIPELLLLEIGKYAKGNPIGVGTSAIYIFVGPVIIFFPGITFAFLNKK